MKFFLLILGACLALQPLSAQAVEETKFKSLATATKGVKGLNFYVANNLSPALMPGMRWQLGRWGIDTNVAINRSGLCNIALSGLVYFNPEAKTKHYLALGLNRRFAGEDFFFQNDDSAVAWSAARYRFLMAYGFQKGLKGASYMFMNFGIRGPNYFWLKKEKDVVVGFTQLPFINLGYAF